MAASTTATWMVTGAHRKPTSAQAVKTSVTSTTPKAPSTVADDPANELASCATGEHDAEQQADLRCADAARREDKWQEGQRRGTRGGVKHAHAIQTPVPGG